MQNRRPPDILNELHRLQSLEEVRECLLQEVAQYGFKHFACTEIPQFGEALAPLWLVDQWPRGWKQRYMEQNYVERDPMVRELFQTYLPYRWDEVVKRREFSPQDLRIVFEASEFQMCDGFVIPLHALDGRTAVVTMAGPESNLDDPRARGELMMIATFAHARLRELHPRSIRAPFAPLSDRERECLRWAAAGKTDWEIGEILSINHNTVHKHIESAKRRLNVTTRMQAVVHALVSRQIMP